MFIYAADRHRFGMKQLDVVVSPPAFFWNPYLTLTYMSFDLDPRDLWPLGRMSNTLCRVLGIHVFSPHVDLDLWPTTLTLNHVTLTLVTFDVKATGQTHHVECPSKSHSFLTWWPWPLTFAHNLHIADVHLHIKFGDPKSNGCWDMNFF